MTARILATLILAGALLAGPRAASREPTDFQGSISSIRQYADSFKGLSVEAARTRLAGAKITEKEWKEGNFGGLQLVATFPEYEVRVLFSDGKAITTSVQILSK